MGGVAKGLILAHDDVIGIARFMPALLTSQTQATGHRMAAFTAVLSRL